VTTPLTRSMFGIAPCLGVMPAATGRRAMWCAVLLLGLACTTEPPPPPPALGRIQGVVRNPNGAAGIGGAVVVLRRAARDSLAAALTGEDGAFSFAELTPGDYRIAARIPPGHLAASPSDTTQVVTLGPGATVTVVLTASPITLIQRSTQPGRTDTLVLGNGAVAIVQVPVGGPMTTIRLTTFPSDSATWGRNMFRPAAGFEVVAGAPSAGVAQGTMAAATSTITLALPVGSIGGGQQAAMFGLFPNGQGGTWIHSLRSDPITMPGQFDGSSIAALSISVPAANSTVMSVGIAGTSPDCLAGYDLQKVGGTGPRPLLLIHGIQLQLDACDDYLNWRPERTTFKDLLAALVSELGDTYTIYALRYPTNDGVQLAASYLAANAARIIPQPSHPMAIVAHSMGGLVARRFLGDSRHPPVQQVITLATPHFGTKVAEADLSVLDLQVFGCYHAFQGNSSTPPVAPWLYFHAVKWALFQAPPQSVGVNDLSPANSIAAEPFAGLFSTFAGVSGINGVDHNKWGLFDSGTFVNGTMTAAGCYLELNGQLPNDGFVPQSSAWPPWSPRKFGPFPRDHIQMAGGDAADVKDEFLPTIVNLLRFGPTAFATLTRISGDGQIGNAGVALPQPVRTALKASDGSPVVGAQVTFAPDVGSGIANPPVARTDASGQATAQWVLGASNAVQHLMVKASGAALASVRFNALAVGGSPCPATSYTLGTTVAGSLPFAQCVFAPPPLSTGERYREYVSSTPSRALVVTMTSGAFAPRGDISIEPSFEWSLGFQASGSGVVRYKAIVPPGTFKLRATGQGGPFAPLAGDYTIRAEVTVEDVQGCELALLASDVVTTQSIAAGDCSWGYDDYLVGVPQGWTASVVMKSAMIDPYLEVYHAGLRVASDDNGAGGTGALITFSYPQASTSVFVRASARGSIRQGSYTIRLDLQPPSGVAALPVTAQERVGRSLPAPAMPPPPGDPPK